MGKRILLMYISLNSGHDRASQGIEKAIHQLSPGVQLSSVNVLHYLHPFLVQLIKQSYFNLIRHYPQGWDYLYDHPWVVRQTQSLRQFLYNSNFAKLRTLLETFKPGVVACTQAFPCGMFAAYKETFQLGLPLVGVLTDFGAHAYWMHEKVDYYVVPSEKARANLCTHGVSDKRILTYGIPIDPRFCLQGDRNQIFQKLGLSPEVPTLLVMGGSYGIGPIRKVVRQLDRSALDIQIIVVCGKNGRLFSKLSRRSDHTRKKVRIFGFVDNVDELMEISTCLITKPGGVTTAEALTKSLPMILLTPIGGQESANAEFLLREGIALKVRAPKEVIDLTQGLLEHPARLQEMRRSAEKQRRPTSALELARMLLSMA